MSKIVSKEGNWKKIKNRNTAITDEEADEMIKITKEFRKNFEFRY